MSIFNLHSSVLDDYRNFVGSYFTIADERALFDQTELWPEPLLQLSPSYACAASAFPRETFPVLQDKQLRQYQLNTTPSDWCCRCGRECNHRELTKREAQ
jgi:hypothetical protein